MPGGIIAFLILVGAIAFYVRHGERLVAQHRRELVEELQTLVGERVTLTLSGRVMWTVTGVVQSVSPREVVLRNDSGENGAMPLIMVREIKNESSTPRSRGARPPKYPWWRTRANWPSPGTRSRRWPDG